MWNPVSVQRNMCGGTSNMTAHANAYKRSGNICYISSKLASKKKKGNLNKLHDCLY